MRRFVLCLFLLHFVAGLATAADKPLNVILLLVDDWGWTDAGCCGSDLYQTPHIDQLAKDGVRFTHGYAACTVCSPTRAAIMSGKYPPKTGVTSWISGPTMKLRHEEVTVAEALKAAGYNTFHVGNTLIILTGDNGGLDRRGNPTDNAPLRAGKGSAYEGGARVPTFVAGPGVAVGAECAEPVVSVDYYPTILELTGASGVARHNAEVDGVSIAQLLKDPTAKLDCDAIYWHYPHSHGGGSKPHGAIRAGNWRLVRFYGSDQVELYDLAADVGEQNDLAEKMPAKAAQLREQLDGWLVVTGAKIPSGKKRRKGRG